MIRFGSKVFLLLLFSAALVGCEPEQQEDQPQQTDPPGVDMDADRTVPDRGADVEIDVEEDLDRTTPPLGTRQPGTVTPGAGVTDRPEPGTPTLELPTETPRTGEGATIPEVDIDAPEGESPLGGEQGEATVPEVDIQPPGAGGGGATGGAQGGATVPEVDPS